MSELMDASSREFERIKNLSKEELDAELRADGYDPDIIGKWGSVLVKTHLELAQARKELESAKEVLEFYANENNYREIVLHPKHPGYSATRIAIDRGNLARSILKPSGETRVVGG